MKKLDILIITWLLALTYLAVNSLMVDGAHVVLFDSLDREINSIAVKILSWRY